DPLLRLAVRRTHAGRRGVPQRRAALRHRAPPGGPLRHAHPRSLRRAVPHHGDDARRRHRRAGGIHVLSTASTAEGASAGPTFPAYLRVDELLAMQAPASEPQHPDELLFIIVHQASELWFKAILHELDGLVAAF